MVNRVLVMRHAHRYSDTYSIGDDPQLTPQGHEQAQQVAELLRSRDLPLVAIFRCAGARAPAAAAHTVIIPVEVWRAEVSCSQLILDSSANTRCTGPSSQLALAALNPDSGPTGCGDGSPDPGGPLFW